MIYNTQVAIIGAGPAGLSAAIEIAKDGGQVMVFDENDRPGGQLFKQIHKFFGSEHHGAGIRGFRFGEKMLEDCRNLGVDIRLNTVVYGMFPDNELGIVENGKSHTVKAERIIVATGATEKPLAFPGWDLPGVMGAGAAQTMMNINRVQPGNRIVMIGSGNVGLVVSYQLLQAGMDVVALVEGLPKVNGYDVHANKLKRQGVPFYMSHTIVEAKGNGKVEEVVIAEVGPRFAVKEGTEKVIKADTVCLAVGLMPSLELLRMSGAAFTHIPAMGGYVPMHSKNMQTTNSGIYVAGDVAGIEEASTAMEEGKLAGIAVCKELGILDEADALKREAEVNERISELRIGSHGEKRREAKDEIIRRYDSWKEK
ncbi:MAG: NAD(P)/FAD-dependent oxidoreductase [Clostridia bacterium]|nr:NAD(P)/FAD-dependent oxidoreductase [Clostridia bacterium]